MRGGNVEGHERVSRGVELASPRPLSGLPAAPTAVTAAPDAEAALVRWTAPDDGGSALTSYTVTPVRGGTGADAR